VVEVAEISPCYGLSTKAPIYTAHGAPEYWAINAGTLITMVHKNRSAKPTQS